MTSSTLPSSMGTAVVLLPRRATVVGAGLGEGTVRQDCEGSRPSRVGQASDQVSDVVGQAGAGQRGGNSRGRHVQTAGDDRATRAAALSLHATPPAGQPLPP